MEEFLYDFNPWGGWITVVALLAVTIFIVLLVFKRATVPLHGKHSKTILLLRILSLLTLLFITVRVSFVHVVTVQEKTPLLITLDTSLSMEIKSSLKGQSRWQILQQFLEDNSTRIHELEKTFDVEWASFDSSLKPYNPSTNPSGYKTAIGDILKQWRSKLPPGSPASILILSDGMSNFGTDPIELASTLRLEKRKIFAVGIGDRSDSISKTDASIEDILLPDEISSADKITVEAFAKFRGLAGAVITVQFLVDGIVVGTQDIVPRNFDDSSKLLFTLDPYNPGSHLLEVRIPEIPGESTTGNNNMSTYFKVVKGGGSILYVESSLRFEYTFLKRLLRTNKSFSFHTALLGGSKNKANAVLPSIWRRYDLIILGDVPASILGLENMEAIKSQVEAGGSLITLGGLSTYGAGGYEGSPIGDILPFNVTSEDVQHNQPITLVPSFDAIDVPYMQIFEQVMKPKELLQNFASLPLLAGFTKVAGVKEGSELIARTPQGDPLIAERVSGKGRVVSLTMDSTWRWAFNSLPPEADTSGSYKKFWNRLTNSMVLPRKRGEFNVVLSAESGKTTPNSKITINVEVTDLERNSVSDAELIVLAKNPIGRNISIPVSYNGTNWEGIFEPKLEGHYTLSAIVTKDNKKLGYDEMKIISFLRDRETSNPDTNFSLLESISLRTGGNFSVWANPVPIFVSLQQISETYKAQTKIMEPFWSTPLVFLFFLLLISLEWILRKKRGLP